MSRRTRESEAMTDEGKKRKIRQISSAADRAELERHYSFLPSESTKTWQDRMVKHYHAHLYKEYVLADLTRPGKVGLRWRTRAEVENGKGQSTCGNKHCPSYQLPENPDKAPLQAYYETTTNSGPQNEEEEQALLETVPYGLGLCDYEVPFEYEERGETKEELVKLRLCLRCAPLLFRKRDKSTPFLDARKARQARDNEQHMEEEEEDHEIEEESHPSSSKQHGLSSSSDDDSAADRRRTSKKRKKRRQRREKKTKRRK